MLQAIFDDKDFEKLSFHDNFVHAMTFDPETGELLLDIDYLAKWISPEKRRSFFICHSPVNSDICRY